MWFFNLKNEIMSFLVSHQLKGRWYDCLFVCCKEEESVKLWRLGKKEELRMDKVYHWRVLTRIHRLRLHSFNKKIFIDYLLCVSRSFRSWLLNDDARFSRKKLWWGRKSSEQKITDFSSINALGNFLSSLVAILYVCKKRVVGLNRMISNSYMSLPPNYHQMTKKGNFA